MLLTEQNIQAGVFGSDLTTVFRKRFGVQVKNIRRLSEIAFENLHKATFKMTLADGHSYTIKRFFTVEEAQRAYSVAPFLNTEHFPKVLDIDGRDLLIEWIEGERQKADRSEKSFLQKAALIQAELHKTNVPQSLIPAGQISPAYWIDRLKKKITLLIRKGLLRESEGSFLMDVIGKEGMNNVSMGLVHGDFQPEHIVIDPRGQFFLIDLELIAVNAICYGLARMLYLWLMSYRQRQFYFKCYDVREYRDELEENILFWMSLVLSESAVFRAQVHADNVNEPLKKLKKIIQDPSKTRILKDYGLKENRNG